MRLPYGNGFLMAILRPALDPVEVGTRLPADASKQLPQVIARTLAGGDALMPIMTTRVRVPTQIDAFAGEARAAHNLVADALHALYEAWDRQTVTSDGHLGFIENVAGPFEVLDRDRPSTYTRWAATAQITLRPPAA